MERVKPAGVMAVVKADAYGHGALPVTRRLVREGAAYLGVANPEEGIELRKAGIETPILVFGSPFKANLDVYYKYNLSITLCTWEQAEAIHLMNKKMGELIPCHVKVDTGMGRIGFAFDMAADSIRRMIRELNIEPEGIYTHFATSDMKDKAYADLQLQRFKAILKVLEKEDIRIPIRHAANSGAILDMTDAVFDMVRPGVMLYGYYPSTETTESLPLKPAMTFKAIVSFVKKVEAGTGVSYGRTHVCSENTVIATLPVGYADGYNRLLSGKGIVRINGKPYPVIGRVCMDMIMVDVGKNSDVAIGDEAVLFGPDEEDVVSVEAICRTLDTIPYEVTCWVSKRVPRAYTL